MYTVHLYVQEMPSFSLMMLPSLESITASVSPSAFFFRKRFKPEHRTTLVQNSSACHMRCTGAQEVCPFHTDTQQVAQGRTLAQLAICQRGRSRQRVGRVLKLAERLELDDLQVTRQQVSAASPCL